MISPRQGGEEEDEAGEPLPPAKFDRSRAQDARTLTLLMTFKS